MFRKLAVVCVMTAFAWSSGTSLADDAGAAKRGWVFRPVTVKAKVPGCMVAKPGRYAIKVGELIELDYIYPVTPEATPTKVDFALQLKGVIVPSPLGIRYIDTTLIGTQTIGVFFEAKKTGAEQVELIIDDATYVYNFKVQ